MSKSKILCVDDELNVLSALKRILEIEGFEVFIASFGMDALSILDNETIDVVLIDYMMPEINGIELLRRIKKANYDVESIMVTAYSDVSLVVEAMKEGAYDYIVKPWNDELLISIINKVLNYKKLLREKEFLIEQLKEKHKYKNLIGISPGIEKIYNIIEKVKDTNDTVLIQGESGTGKEQVARAIHFEGARRDKLFVPVDCVSLSPNVIESELFGHIKGAFTGASQAKEGLLKSAGSGTIFLDEISEIPLGIQVKLLRAIQEMKIKPVGSNKMEDIEARVIAATNRDLYKLVEKGEFREDLFYRLNVVYIKIPPLREHKGDIPVLINHFIEKYNTDARYVKGVNSNGLKVLTKYDFPGNIRELENFIKRAFTLGSSDYIDVDDLPEDMLLSERFEKSGFKKLADIEREHIINAIIESKGNKRKAAKVLGISESTIYNKIKQYNINL